MAESAQEKEFMLFGFVDKRLRAGILVGFLVLSLSVNAILFKMYIEKSDSIEKLQERMYERILAEVQNKVDKKLEKPVEDINAVTKRVADAVSKVDSSRQIVDSVNHIMMNKIK